MPRCLSWTLELSGLFYQFPDWFHPSPFIISAPSACGCSSVETSDSGVCCCFNHMAVYSPPMVSSSSCLQTESSQTQHTVSRQTACRKVYKRNCTTRKFHLSVFLWKLRVNLKHCQRFLTCTFKIGDLLDYNLDWKQLPRALPRWLPKWTSEHFSFTGGRRSQMKASLWLQKSLKGEETLGTISIPFLSFSQIAKTELGGSV